MVLLRSVAYFVVFYVNTALFLVLGSWLLLAPRRWAMQGLRLHGLASLWWLKVICGTHLEVRGREKLPAGACLVASKHQSAWDTFALIPVLRDPAMVMKAELGWIPLYGWFSHKFRHIFVRRDKGPSALKALIRDARDRAAHGREIVIFPEGTRRPPGAPPDYKPGFLALYDGLGLPCVPLALNSGLFWPRRSLMRYPGTIVIEILDPIPPGLSRAQARATIQEKIETACALLIAEARAQPDPPPLPADGARQPNADAPSHGEPDAKIGKQTIRLERRADHERPEGLELALGVLDQRYAHVLGVGKQQVLVVAGTGLPAFHHFLDAGLAGADVLSRDLGRVAGALHSVPRVGAVRPEVRNAVPFRQIARMRPCRLGEGRLQLQGAQSLGLAIGIDEFACPLGVEARAAVVAIRKRAYGCFFECALGGLVIGFGHGALGGASMLAVSWLRFSRGGGWPELAKPEVSEELPMPQPARHRDRAAGTSTRYITTLPPIGVRAMCGA